MSVPPKSKPSKLESSSASSVVDTGAPTWLVWTLLILSLAGLAVSIYLTIAHYNASTTLACPETGIINCAKVTSSSYSTLFGIPLAVLGLLFFVAVAVLNLPVLWRSHNKWLRIGRLLLAASGILMVFRLLYIELFNLDAICLYCTVVHILSLAIFALTAIGTALSATNTDG